MSKFEQAEYLANLIAIMENKEDGGLPKGKTLTAEYTRAYDEFVGELKKEAEDEARQRANSDGSDEGRTASSPDRSGSGGQDRNRPADREDNPGRGTGSGFTKPDFTRNT